MKIFLPDNAGQRYVGARWCRWVFRGKQFEQKRVLWLRAMAVGRTHPDYDPGAAKWARARDVLAGEDAVKAGGSEVSAAAGFAVGGGVLGLQGAGFVLQCDAADAGGVFYRVRVSAIACRGVVFRLD